MAGGICHPMLRITCRTPKGRLSVSPDLTPQHLDFSAALAACQFYFCFPPKAFGRATGKPWHARSPNRACQKRNNCVLMTVSLCPERHHLYPWEETTPGQEPQFGWIICHAGAGGKGWSKEWQKRWRLVKWMGAEE